MTERVKSVIPFVNLHGHSTFSVFDGLGFPDEHMDFAYENGMDALALTDHDSLNFQSSFFFPPIPFIFLMAELSFSFNGD